MSEWRTRHLTRPTKKKKYTSCSPVIIQMMKALFGAVLSFCVCLAPDFFQIVLIGSNLLY